MEDDGVEKLFLLEFLAESIKVVRTLSVMNLISNDEWAWNRGQMCIRFSFLNFPVLEICEEDFITKPAGKEYATKFRNGKSCLFPLSSKTCSDKITEFKVEISVLRKLPADILPEAMPLGFMELELSELFNDVISTLINKPNDVPACKTIKIIDCLKRDNYCGGIGELILFVRLSCYGPMIVTQFQLGKAGSAFIFKGKEGGELYQCEKVAPCALEGRPHSDVFSYKKDKKSAPKSSSLKKPRPVQCLPSFHPCCAPAPPFCPPVPRALPAPCAPPRCPKGYPPPRCPTISRCPPPTCPTPRCPPPSCLPTRPTPLCLPPACPPPRCPPPPAPCYAPPGCPPKGCPRPACPPAPCYASQGCPPPGCPPPACPPAPCYAPSGCPPPGCPPSACPPAPCYAPQGCPPPGCPPSACPPASCYAPSGCPPKACPRPACPPPGCPPPACPPPACPPPTCPPAPCYASSGCPQPVYSLPGCPPASCYAASGSPPPGCPPSSCPPARCYAPPDCFPPGCLPPSCAPATCYAPPGCPPQSCAPVPYYTPQCCLPPQPACCEAYQEIGAELNGHAIKIKVPKKRKEKPKDESVTGSLPEETPPPTEASDQSVAKSA